MIIKPEDVGFTKPLLDHPFFPGTWVRCVDSLNNGHLRLHRIYKIKSYDQERYYMYGGDEIYGYFRRFVLATPAEIRRVEREAVPGMF